MTIALLVVMSLSAAANALPAWFPMTGVGIDPNQLEPEDFGSDEFNVGGTTVTVKGKHWATSLYPAPDPNGPWDGVAIWKRMRPLLEKQGFAVVYLSSDGSDVTLRKGSTYVALHLSKDDAFSNWVHIVDEAGNGRMLTLTAPAATPETIVDDKDFPYVTPLTGAKLLSTSRENGPLDVTTPRDQEPRFVGTGTITKLYEGPAGVSNEDFVATYDQAFRKAGWTTALVNGLYAHYTKSGRDIWAHVYQEGANRWDVTIADVGSGLRAALAKGCKATLYGLTFDFNKTTLRADAEPVLQQVLAIMKSDAAGAFELDGHTDNVGDKAYNLKLSQGRADAVKSWLVSHAVKADRLTTKGFGDGKPVVPNDSDVGRAKNRRVELIKAGCS